MAVGEVRHFSRALESDVESQGPDWIEWAREEIPSLPLSRGHEPIVLLVREGELPLADDPDVKPEGVKDDDGKPEFSQIPVGTLVHVAHVLTDGAKHYKSDDNWQRVKNPRKRYWNAAQRHLDSYWSGEAIDPKSGRPHLAHAIADLMFLLWFQINEKQEK